jgi:hypothetical protein
VNIPQQPKPALVAALEQAPALSRPSWTVPLARLGRRLSDLPHNERVLYAESVWQAIVDSWAFSFLAVFLVRLGAPNWQVGLLDSLPALVTTVVSIPMGALVARRGRLVRTTNLSKLLFRTTIGLFALLPFLPPATASVVMVGAYTLLFIPGAAGNIAFVTLLGQATTVERRPQMLSTRMAIQGLVGAGTGLLAGLWLGRAPYPLNYSVLFLGTFLAGMVSILIMSKIKLPPWVGPVAQPGARHGLGEIVQLLRDTPLFRRYSVAAFLFRMGMSLPMALYAIYRVRVVGATDAWIGVLFTVERALSVVTYFALGRLLSRPKWRRWLWLSCVGLVFYPFTMALARTPAGLLAPHIFSGFFSAGTTIFMSNLIYQVAPKDRYPTFVSIDATLANVTGFVAPMLGIALMDVVGIHTALLIITGLRVLGGLSFRLVGVTNWATPDRAR